MCPLERSMHRQVLTLILDMPTHALHTPGHVRRRQSAGIIMWARAPCSHVLVTLIHSPLACPAVTTYTTSYTYPWEYQHSQLSAARGGSQG